MKNKTHILKIALGTVVCSLFFSSCEESKEKSAEPQQITETRDPSLDTEPTTEPASDTATQTDESALAESSEPTPTTPELIENPQYTSWAKFGVGTTVVIETTSESQGVGNTTTMTQTLTEVTPESLTYEVKIKGNFAGQEMDFPPQPQVIPSKVPAGTPISPSQMPGVEVLEEGEEQLKIGDLTITARRTKFRSKGGEGDTAFESLTTIWESPEIPGGVVKMENEVSMGEMQSKSSMVIKEIHKK